MVIVTVLGFLAMLFSMAQRTKCNANFEVSFSGSEEILYDFTNQQKVDDWVEQSDTVREVGMSKAVLTMQNTQIFNRAILFTLLNPQPNGACFAGVRKFTTLNLENYNYITLKIRGKGDNKNYKIILRHKNKNDEPNPTYEQFFTAPTEEFEVISLPFSEFQPYYRGKQVNNTEPLDRSFITNFGIQIYGGVYLPQKQSGASSLEIDWIGVKK